MIDSFKLFYKRIFAVILIFMQINCNFCDSYKGENKGYASVPTDIGNNVRIIDLDRNNISYIDDKSFDETSTNFSNVRYIYLSENRIANISERAFKGFHKLKYFRLNDNRLRNITLTEEDIPKLFSLSVEENQLTKLPKFCGFFRSLSQLYLRRNFISHVDGDDFENITNVEYIYLSNNRPLLCEPRQELSGLRFLYLATNNLKEMPTLQGTYNSLRILKIQNNNISFKSLLMIKERINGSELSLNSLYLGGNEDLSNNLFAMISFLEQFPNLFGVGFSNLKISEMFPMRFLDFDLSKNNITEISEEFVRNTTPILRINLDNNPIEILPNLYQYIMASNVHDTYITLKGIKFQCDNLCWMSRVG